jgi:hypothetical protein
MTDILQEILIVAGMTGLSILWIFAVAGMLQVGWIELIEPLVEKVKKRR